LPIKAAYGPWPDLATARSFLSLLYQGVPAPVAGPAADALARWLIDHELGPLAYVRFQTAWPQLGQQLQAAYFAAAAENQLHQENLRQITAAFARARLPLVVLKGSALAQMVYPDPACRPMSDIDLWLEAERMAEAINLMTELGFQTQEKAERPTKLQRLSGGEIRFGRPHWVQGLVELHWSPMPGWWFYHTAVPNTAAMWQRRLPLPLVENGAETADLIGQLDPEDTIIQIAAHIAVNHQFSGMLLRSLADIALTAAARPVNWSRLAERARAWRLGTAVYLTLTLTDQLFDLPACQPACDHLRPGSLRCRLLARLVNPRTALNRADIRTSLARQYLLLLLVDRPRDGLRLIGRTLWPTAEWRAARYGRPTGPLSHFWHLLRTRQI
jgi:hypothetical protein